MLHQLAMLLPMTLVMLLFPTVAPAQTVSDDLRKKIESGWTFLQQLDEKECQYTIKYYSFDSEQGGLRPGSAVVRIDRKPGYFRETTVTKDVTGIFCFNPDYCFTIGKREGKGAYLTRITKTEPGIINPDIRDVIQTGDEAKMCYPLSCVYHQPGPELLRNPSFTITSSRQVSNGLLDVSVRFDITIPGWNRPPLPTSITLTLDPNKHCCALGYRLDPSMGERKDIEFNRAVEEMNGRLVCTHSELKQPSKQTHNVYEFVDYDFGTKHPDEQYYLSHYGLPEPVGVTAPAKPTPIFVWMLIATAVAFALAIVFRHSAKRLSASRQ
jgi:hypothetical protein